MIFSARTIAAGILAAGVVEAQCYNPKGEAIELNGDDSRTWIACAPRTPGGHSQCCATDETCTDFGLCEQSGRREDGSTYRFLYREYCTDRTWNTLACSNVCMNGGFEGAGTVLTLCDDGSVCCGAGEWAQPNCCDKKLGVQVDEDWRIIRSDEAPSPSPPTSTTSPPETASQTSASSTASDTPSDTPTSSPVVEDPGDSEAKSIGGGAIAGIVVGAVAGVGVIAAGAFFWRRRARKGREGADGEGFPVAAGMGAPYQGYYKPVDEAVREMEVPVDKQGTLGPGAVEMPARERGGVYELPGEGRAELR